MTSDEYEKLENIFGELYLHDIEKWQFDLETQNTYIVTGSETIYIKETTLIDRLGHTITTVSEKITEAEYKSTNSATSMVKSITPIIPFAINLNCNGYSSGTCHYTTSKRVYIEKAMLLGGSGYQPVRISLIAEWNDNTLPAVREFDLIGIRWSPRSGSGFTYTGHDGRQEYNGSGVITYGQGGTNSKVLNNGTSIAQNVVDSVTSELRHKIYLYGNITSYGYVDFYGSFQHCNAYAGCTLTEAKNHTFSSNGKGGVFSFGTQAISNKYDGMAGVSIWALY